MLTQYEYSVGTNLLLDYTSNRMLRGCRGRVTSAAPPSAYQPLNYMQNVQPSCKPRPLPAPAFQSTPLDTFTCICAVCLFSRVRVSSLHTYIRRTCVDLSAVALHGASHFGEEQKKRWPARQQMLSNHQISSDYRLCPVSSDPL
jgi:hypothetical protein